MNDQHTIILHQRFTVFPGIEYIKEVFDDDQDGRQCAHILRICRGADVRIDSVMRPDGQFLLQEPTVSAKACRKENETLIGVINADFFNMTNGVPQGVVVMNGNILKEEMPDNTHFFGIYQDGQPVIGDKTLFLNSKQRLKMAVGGRDILVDGEETPEPVLMPIPCSHPRTAVCIGKEDELFLVVLDGRNPGVSEGMHLTRFGLYLKSLGARKALNLDGGGSTLMALRMLGQQEIEIVNTPSDGMERVCANGIAVFAQHQGDGICHSAYVSPQQEYIAPGMQWKMSAYGLDDLLGPCALPTDIQFSVPADSGCSISEDGLLLTAQNECDVTVAVSSGERLLGEALLHVRTPDALHAPQRCICAEDEPCALEVAATLKGRDVLTNRTSYTFYSREDIVWLDEAGFFHTKKEQGEDDVCISIKNSGPSAKLHVCVGRLPQPIAIDLALVRTVGCTIDFDQPLYFSPRSGKQVYRIETQQAACEMQFDASVYKRPKAVGMWVHGLKGEMPAFTLKAQSGMEVLQPTAFACGEPSDSVWTYMEAPVLGGDVQAGTLKIGISMTGSQAAQFAIDSFRVVYDYVEDDARVPEIKRVSINKYTQAGEMERIKITAYFGVGDLLPCYAPIDYKRLRILIDETEYTGLPGHYGVNKGTASLMLHNVFVSKGIHRVSVCAQTYSGMQAWKTIIIDTDQLEIKH